MHATTEGPPPFGVYMDGEHMEIILRYKAAGQSSYKEVVAYRDPNPIQRGHAYDTNVQVNFDPNGNGSLNVWRDGVQIVKYQGAIGMAGANYYWKEGIYRAPAAETFTASFSNVDITTGSASAPTAPTTPTSLVGGALNDSISAGNGWDFIDGGAGNDQIYGGAGNDILRGGTGADVLNGGQGNDTFAFNRGDGTDVIFDYYQAGANGGSDTLAFGAGIKPSDLEIQRSGSDLIVGIKDPTHSYTPFAQLTDKIVLHDWADPLDRIESFVFSDGTVWDVSNGINRIADPTIKPVGADFDGNGHDDILWANDIGTVSIWNNGQTSGAHDPANGVVVPTNWHIAGTGDFDGNGKDDILWYSGGALTVWDNGQLAGAHDPAHGVVVPTNWQIAGVGDFDGNGKDDILWYSGGALAIWDNGDVGRSHDPANGVLVPTNWHIAGTGDFDGNGKDDILWSDGASAVIWDNGQVGGAHEIAHGMANSWHVL